MQLGKYIFIGACVLGFGCIALISVVYAWNEIDLSSSDYTNLVKQNEKFNKKEPPQAIAVVGGGIGGTSAAYFFRQMFGNAVDIDVYESSNRLCGRVATLEIGNRIYESGAMVMHAKNMYAKSIAHTFGLEEAKSIETYTALFDGKEYVLEASQWSIITLFKFLWTFGLDFFRLYWQTNIFMDKFATIYDLHRRGHSYTSVENLLKAQSGGLFVNSSEITSCQYFADNNYGDKIVTDFVNGGLRSNYGQTCKVNGFVGMVSMAGIQPDLWSVKGGNKLLCEKLFANCNSSLINEEVTRVSNHTGGKFRVETKTSHVKRSYDIVVIATPINRDKSDIDVKEVFTGKGDCPSAVTDPRHYRQTVNTLVKGKLNSELFGCNSPSTCPDGIFMTEDLFYRSVGLRSPVDFDPQNGDSVNDTVYGIFSTETLTEEQLSILFDHITEKTAVTWQAYPHYSPPDQLDTFVLNENGVYYTSPIEWAASAMEMSIISAKNVALLAFNNWYGMGEKIDRIDAVQHSEL